MQNELAVMALVARYTSLRIPHVFYAHVSQHSSPLSDSRGQKVTREFLVLEFIDDGVPLKARLKKEPEESDRDEVVSLYLSDWADAFQEFRNIKPHTGEDEMVLGSLALAQQVDRSIPRVLPFSYI